MITSVIAIPKIEMKRIKDKVLLNNNIIAISIIDPSPNESIIFEDDTSRVITVRFSDITPGPFHFDHFDFKDERFMSSEDANKIVEFVLKWVNSEEDMKLFINCSAGICRSGAIATWAFKHSEMKDTDFVLHNPFIKPNEWVLWKLIEAEINWRK